MQTETINTHEDLEERNELYETIMQEAEAKANSQAQKILKKNSREIVRLKEHAGNAVLENNFPAYKYALEKLRTIYKQPFNDEIINTMWQTSRKTVWDIINAGTSKV